MRPVRVRRSAGVIPLLILFGLAGAARADLRDDLRAARARLDAGDRAGALAASASIVEQFGSDPGARDAWYMLAQLSRSGQDYVRGLEGFLDHGGRRDRRAAAALIGLGRYHYVMGDYRAALGRLEEAREARGEGGDHALARYWLGRTLLALGEWDDARRAFEAVIGDRAAGDLAEGATFLLGEVMRARGDDGAAARIFGECRAKWPRGSYLAAARFGEARARERQGDKREAAALYADILRDFPSSIEAADSRAWLAVQRTERGPATARDDRPPVPAAGGPRGVADGRGESAPAAAPAPAAPAAEPSTGAGDWRVQVGAFAARDNALRLAADLEKRGYPAVTVEEAGGRDAFFHVRFGRYRDQGAAVHAAEEVSAALGLRYQLVPPDGERSR